MWNKWGAAAVAVLFAAGARLWALWLNSDGEDPLNHLPAVDHGVDADLSEFSTANDVTELGAKADVVMFATIEREEPPQVINGQERESGAHGEGYATYVAKPLEVLKAKSPAMAIPAQALRISQYATWFEGDRTRPEWDVPLEPGNTYLLFLKAVRDTPYLSVVYPHIHQEIDGKLYWNGARGWQGNRPGEPQVGRNPADPLMAFWEMPRAEAIALLTPILSQ